MWLVAGLGNPGSEYARTRHNVGFLVVQALALGDLGARLRPLGASLVAKIHPEGHDVVLACPQTFMNRSGIAIREVLGAFQIPLERLVVVHDDVDLPFGQLRLKAGGGHGGHNGLRSIVAELDSAEFSRVRIGIGRPEAGDLIEYVLGPWEPSQAANLADVLHRGAEASLDLISEGFLLAANRWNQRQGVTPSSPPRTEENECVGEAEVIEERGETRSLEGRGKGTGEAEGG